MKSISILFFLVSFFNSVFGRYEPTFLAQLVNTKIIVTGTIDSVGDHTIKVRVTSVINGYINDSLITLEKFEDWTCAHRFLKYEIGQNSLFFLSYDKLYDVYHIRGAGNEGELPISNDSIVYEDFDSPYCFKVYEGRMCGHRFKKIELIEAIRYYLNHKEEIKTYCLNNKKSDNHPNNNKALRFIIDEMIKYKIVNYDPLKTKELGDSAVFTGPMTVVAALKMNVLYKGVNNPISISVKNKNQFIVKTDNGIIMSKGNKYLIRPSKIGVCHIIICDIKGKEIKSWDFRVKRIPSPVTSFAASKGTSELNKNIFLAFDRVYAVLENFDYEIFFRIKSFKVQITYEDTLTKHFEIKTGNRITPELKEFFKTLKPRDKIYFYDVTARLAENYDDDTFILEPLTIYLK